MQDAVRDQVDTVRCVGAQTTVGVNVKNVARMTGHMARGRGVNFGRKRAASRGTDFMNEAVHISQQLVNKTLISLSIPSLMDDMAELSDPPAHSLTHTNHSPRLY